MRQYFSSLNGAAKIATPHLTWLLPRLRQGRFYLFSGRLRCPCTKNQYHAMMRNESPSRFAEFFNDKTTT
jgi:hypothetical protein